MTKEFWLNLPVKDLQKSKAFFAQLGFTFHPRHEHSEELAGMFVGNSPVIIMLFPESAFQGFISNEIADTARGNEMLISFDAESKEEVDEVLDKAVKAGGTIYGKPTDQGWMYGGGFIDLDGHRWNVLYMDQNKMPQA
ncbi:VOC family protein [Paenibacillus aceris]|uniref:Lactoylglutathione lyase n=1 Tax=Paenibacillus aceris TaxID=869555 RepID=A0ABS4HY22_9BACL|nr:VOC family protein [Paenibacillus aceris]MBP1963562.1 putative lactoylglutathione lyase [Paenibacillus aceris]NHW36826.1 extradiol dioxygenase [Paenibacillus aceris]